MNYFFLLQAFREHFFANGYFEVNNTFDLFIGQYWICITVILCFFLSYLSNYLYLESIINRKSILFLNYLYILIYISIYIFICQLSYLIAPCLGDPTYPGADPVRGRVYALRTQVFRGGCLPHTGGNLR